MPLTLMLIDVCTLPSAPMIRSGSGGVQDHVEFQWMLRCGVNASAPLTFDPNSA
jgi:hypothetical protein